MISPAREQPRDDADPNALWLTTAHALCADAGIPPGPVGERLERLRRMLSSAIPVAWLRNLDDPQPHAVTDLRYRSAADAAAGVQYVPVYAAPQAAVPPGWRLAPAEPTEAMVNAGVRRVFDDRRYSGPREAPPSTATALGGTLCPNRGSRKSPAPAASAAAGYTEAPRTGARFQRHRTTKSKEPDMMQSAWISVQDRMPPDDTPVLVYVPGNEMLAFAIDQWQMQREAPLGWSSATIETGMGWCDHDYEDVSHWMPLTAPEPTVVRPLGHGGMTGFNDYLMSDGSVRAMRPDEAVALLPKRPGGGDSSEPRDTETVMPEPPPSEVFSRVHKQLLDAATAQDGDVVELPQAALGPAARGRANRDSSLMHRIRIVVAEAQAEQSAQIERMRAALTQARTVIAVDRASFVHFSTAPDQPLDADDQGIVDEYDGLLRMIDEALGEQS